MIGSATEEAADSMAESAADSMADSAAVSTLVGAAVSTADNVASGMNSSTAGDGERAATQPTARLAVWLQETRSAARLTTRLRAWLAMQLTAQPAHG